MAFGKKYCVTALSLLLLLADYIAITAAEYTAAHLRNLVMHDTALHISWLNFWFLFPLLYIVFLQVNQLYSRRMPFYKEVENIFRASAYGTLAIILVLYVAQIAASTSRLFVGLFAVFTFIFVTICRFAIKKILMERQLLQIPVIIIGAGKTAELLARFIADDPGMGYKIIGLLEDYQVKKGFLEKYPVLGGFADAEKILQNTGVRRVFIAAPGLADEELSKLIYRIQPLVENIGVIPNLVGIPAGSVEIENIFNEKFLLVRLKNNLARPLNRLLKIVFDYALTVVGTLCISPVLLFIALWIYKDSPGPVIFRHIRIGRKGKAFPCYKFRTMCIDAEQRLAELLESDAEARREWARDFKLKNDPRITKSGAFLRRTSLDELPQIFNVLRGEMSLVGPRPVVQEELARYGEYVGDYLLVKPGITGMWQVNGRSDTTYAERVQMDSWYVRNWSVWLDIMLLWRTVKSVIKCKGAY